MARAAATRNLNTSHVKNSQTTTPRTTPRSTGMLLTSKWMTGPPTVNL
jgi:hypothetical protein